MTWIVLNARWRTSQEKSWWSWIWCYQSSQLHNIGCWKPAFSCRSQEWGLYSFAVCTRLWQYSKRELQTNNSVARPITTQVVGRGSWVVGRGSWYPVPERSLGLFEIPSMSQTSVVKASKEKISMMREWARAPWIFCSAKKLPWQGLELCQTFCTKRKSKLEKESTFLQTVSKIVMNSISARHGTGFSIIKAN